MCQELGFAGPYDRLPKGRFRNPVGVSGFRDLGLGVWGVYGFRVQVPIWFWCIERYMCAIIVGGISWMIDPASGLSSCVEAQGENNRTQAKVNPFKHN